MKEENIILDRTFAFAVRIVRLQRYLIERGCERVIVRQLLKSGTSIGANVREAVRGQSRVDFVAKMNIALKEASESEYWLELLHATEYLADQEYDSIYSDCKAITKMLMKIVKTTKDTI
ncbi:MAG: four helix bundle protein [Rikenellaceae bacterium]|nr:four helix bundle protein [Rikenellaceae bacterium]